MDGQTDNYEKNNISPPPDWGGGGGGGGGEILLEQQNVDPDQGPVVQSIVSLTSSLRGQLVKCFTTLLPNTPKIFVEKMREAFAQQKLVTFFQQQILAYFRN